MSTIWGTRSAAIYQFCRGKVEGDGSCLYSSFRYVNRNGDAIDNKRLRSLVADFIRKHENLHLAVLQSGTSCKTVEGYCNEIKKGKLYGGKAELQALAMISKLVIHVVSIKTNTDGSIVVKMLNYGEDKETFKERVYILYDEENKHYDPLYVINKEDSREQSTIFSSNDELVDELLEKFIRQEFGGCYKEAYDKELSNETNLINEAEQLCNIAPTTNTNLSNKRKVLDTVNLWYSKADEIELSLSTWNSDVIDKPKKLTKRNIDEPSVEQHLQTDFFGDEYVIEMGEQPTGNSPTILNEDHEEPRMKFEVEPALKFCGRTQGDFKPKKRTNRRGEPSKPRPPRYFADRNNKRVLNLLIKKKYLSPNAEYRVEIYLITRDIDGYSYVHPYFKIQVDPTNDQVPDENPMYYPFDMANLEEYSEGIKQLPIKLVIVQQINSQLMQVQQPLQIFSSSNTGSAIKETYAKHGAFKEAYHLHDLRFAVTLYKREPGETEFHRCDDMQYISQISTEDPDYKIKEVQNNTNKSIVN